MPTFIDDGFNRDDGYIEPAEPGKNGQRVHDGLTFSYRMSSRRELILAEAKIDKAKYDSMGKPDASIAAELEAAKWAVSKIDSWDFKNRNGEVMPITAESTMFMHPWVFNLLVKILRGWETSDPKPNAEQPKTDEAIRKNSETGSV